jgi:uncharacterized protein (DUF1697 family)
MGVSVLTSYVALLRGINVGGNNKIDMKQLRAAFAEAGFTDARTYINSGNVIFSSDKNADSARMACEALIAGQFGLNIAVVVLSAEELAETLAHAPDWWGSAPDAKHSAIFVIPPATAEGVCAEVGEIKPEYEKCARYGKVIFWSAPMKTFSRTRWGTVSKRTTYRNITIRNATTTYKLAELAKG